MFTRVVHMLCACLNLVTCQKSIIATKTVKALPWLLVFLWYDSKQS